jgi:hypothetical protein
MTPRIARKYNMAMSPETKKTANEGQKQFFPIRPIPIFPQ